MRACVSACTCDLRPIARTHARPHPPTPAPLSRRYVGEVVSTEEAARRAEVYRVPV